MRESFFFAASAASANLQHKTDGSHTNRPFFRALCRTSGKPPFLRKTSSPAMSFVSFLQEKKSYPLLFFLEEKTVSLRGKRSPSDGRTQAHPALSSVGIPQRVCLPPPPCLCPCPPRLRAGFPVQADHAKENHLRLSFFSALLLLSPTCNTKRTSSFLFRRKEAKENHLRKSYYSALLPFQPTCHAKRTVRM